MTPLWGSPGPIGTWIPPHAPSAHLPGVDPLGCFSNSWKSGVLLGSSMKALAGDSRAGRVESGESVPLCVLYNLYVSTSYFF